MGIDFLKQVPESFVGRANELNFLKQYLIDGKSRVAGIFGWTGVGKTSLAVMFAKIFENSLSGNAYHLYANSFIPISKVVLETVPNSSDPLLIIIDESHLIYPDLDAELTRILAARLTSRIIIISQSPIETDVVEAYVDLRNFGEAEMGDIIYGRFHLRLSREELNKLYEKLQGNPLSTIIATDILSSNIVSFDQLLDSIESFNIHSLRGPDGSPLVPESKSYDLMVSDVVTVSEKLLKKLSENPKLLYDISPRLFEEVVAELFQRQGYDVTLTPVSRDGGKDIYVANKSLLGSFLYIVECKKYSPDHPVGVGLIRQLYGVVQAEKATAGILATTSFFTKGAKEFQQQVPFQLSLQDYLGIQRWFKAIHK